MVILPYAKYGIYAQNLQESVLMLLANSGRTTLNVPVLHLVKYRQTIQKSIFCNTYRTEVFKTVPGGHLMGDLVPWFPVEPY